MAPEPSLFTVKIEKEMFKHLKNDDMDELSKNEVVYQVLKQQLKQQQKKLIHMKESKRLRKHTQMLRKKAKSALTEEELQLFTKQIRDF